ncbi:hypothetical protein BSKO_12425 [Bryopsis sp. KO-2023]|nr:hypothetical protein BSKO_12425 [Bryopsis sp. KO-2023]
MAAPGALSTPATVSFSYQQGWTQQYREHADVELIVEGHVLPVHSQLLCQSEVLEGAIRDTQQPGEKIRIRSLFEGTTLAEVDELLSQLYSTTMGIPDSLLTTKNLIDLAMKCGFDRLATRIVETLVGDPTSKHFRLLQHEWSGMGVGVLRYWVDKCTLTRNASLETALIDFLVANYKEVFGSGVLWDDIRDSLCGNGEMCGKILRRIALIPTFSTIRSNNGRHFVPEPEDDDFW